MLYTIEICQMKTMIKWFYYNNTTVSLRNISI